MLARIRWHLAAVAATAVTALALAGPAVAASTVAESVFGVSYDGDDGVNEVVFTDAPAPTLGETRVTISEPGVVAGVGCVQNGANEAYCDISDFDDLDVELKGGNDVATANGTRIGYRLDGGEGNDILTGADTEQGASFFPASDSLRGGPGTDELYGRAGDDSLDPGEGDNDIADGGEGEDAFTFVDTDGAGDVMRGGPGFDKVFTVFVGPDPTPGVTIDLAAGTAQFPGLPATRLESIESADGDEGPDTLLGTDGINDLEGEEENDFIDGRGGPDLLDGEEGDDRLEGRDGSADELVGGSGTDTCDADQLDTRIGCEGGALVELPPFGSFEADRTAPRCAVSGVPKRAEVAKAKRRGVALRATCDETGRLAARLVGRLRRVGGKAKLARAGDIELASRSRAATAGQQVRMRLRPARRLRRLLRKGVRMRVVVVATDAAGNEGTATRRVRLK